MIFLNVFQTFSRSSALTLISLTWARWAPTVLLTRVTSKVPSPASTSTSHLGKVRTRHVYNLRERTHTYSLLQVVYKVGGKLFVCKQEHTPFDVVAWHGK